MRNPGIADDRPILSIAPEKMANSGFGVLVRPYLLGQFRIQLCSASRDSAPGGRSYLRIVRECCTYQPCRMAETVEALRTADDPEALLVALERPWNCEGAGKRIRLDNTLAERVEMQHLRAEYPNDP